MREYIGRYNYCDRVSGEDEVMALEELRRYVRFRNSMREGGGVYITKGIEVEYSEEGMRGVVGMIGEE